MRPLIVLVLILLATAGLVLGLVFLTGDSGSGTGQAVGPAVAKPSPTSNSQGSQQEPTLASVDDTGSQRGSVAVPTSPPAARDEASRPGQGNSLTGRVEDAEGRPLSGAKVKLSREPMMGDDLAMLLFAPRTSPANPIEVTSDGSGSYKFRDIAPATDYYVVASHPKFSPAQESLVYVGDSGEFNGPVMVLRPGSQLNGYVRDIGGNPVPDAEMVLDSAYNMGGELPNYDVMKAKTDNTGYYVFENIPRGPRNLTVSADGYGMQVRNGGELQFKGEAAEQRSMDFTLEPGFPIVGRVLDPEGQGVAGATVSAVYFQNQMTSRGEAVSDATGRFQINDLREGSYIMMVRAQGYSQARMNRVQAGKMDVIIDLKRQACVGGRLLSPAGGTPAMRVELQRTSPKNSPSDIQIFEATDLNFDIPAGSDGSFRICGVEAGFYIVLGLAPGFAPTQSLPVQVIDGQDPPPVALTLRVGGAIRGRVVDASGAPVSGANVVSRDTTSPDVGDDTFFGSFVTSNATERHTTTNSEGEYLLSNLAPATYKVVIEHSSFAGQTAQDLLVGDGQTVQVQPVTLLTGGTVRGTVVSAVGPVERGFLQLYSTTDPSRSYQTRTDNEGRFEFRNVRPGSYKLSATRTSPTSSNDPFQAILDQQASEVVLSVSEGTTLTRELNLGS